MIISQTILEMLCFFSAIALFFSLIIHSDGHTSKIITVPIIISTISILLFGFVYALTPYEYNVMEEHTTEIKIVDDTTKVVQIVRNKVSGELHTLDAPYKQPDKYQVTFRLWEYKPFYFVKKKKTFWEYEIKE